jgi:hypothetical protein
MAGEWIPEKARGLVGNFFPGQWDEVQPGVLQGRCPGEGLHHGTNAATDCRIHLSYGAAGQPPGIYCLHSSCKGTLDDLNGKFREALFAKDPNFKAAAPSRNEGVVTRSPRQKEAWIPAYDAAKLAAVVRATPAVGPEWFEARSPQDPRRVTPGEFLELAFQPEDRVLVFTSFFSQGEFLWEVGRGGYRLAEERGVAAVRSKLPIDGGKDGIWYLCNPVSGKWEANPRRQGKYSRRSEESVTSWRHLVLESDEAPPELWLRFLAMAPLGIVAIYSSGGRSWHALVRVDQPDKASFDALLRNSVKRTLPLLGADPGALTPVRLTRLPGCTRGKNLQRLIYLNPRAMAEESPAIQEMPPLRTISPAVAGGSHGR